MNRTHCSLGLLAAALAAFEVTHPVNCHCADQYRVGPMAVERPPQPEGVPLPPEMLGERVSSATSDGSVRVHPGVGKLELTGYAPTVTVSG